MEKGMSNVQQGEPNH